MVRTFRKMAEEPIDTCKRDGCGAVHRHPVTGAPPDYHWKFFSSHNNWVFQPRWTNPLKTGKDRDRWWFTPAEVAAQMGVCSKTVIAWLRHGRFRDEYLGKTPGGRWRIQGAGVKALLEDHHRLGAGKRDISHLKRRAG